MNMVSRDDLESIGDVYSGDEGAAVRYSFRRASISSIKLWTTNTSNSIWQTRARCWLFVSYIIAFGSVAGSAAVLITCTKNHEHVWVGVVRFLRSFFVPQPFKRICLAILVWESICGEVAWRTWRCLLDH